MAAEVSSTTTVLGPHAALPCSTSAAPRLRFALLTSADIVRASALPPAGVTCEKMSAHGKPVENSLADLRMGSQLGTGPCLTCGHGYKKCLGHAGHIVLAVPLPHPLFRRELAACLELHCLGCGRARRVATPGDPSAATYTRTPADVLVRQALALTRCAHCGAQLPARVTAEETGVLVDYHAHDTPSRKRRAPGGAGSVQRGASPEQDGDGGAGDPPRGGAGDAQRGLFWSADVRERTGVLRAARSALGGAWAERDAGDDDGGEYADAMARNASANAGSEDAGPRDAANNDANDDANDDANNDAEADAAAGIDSNALAALFDADGDASDADAGDGAYGTAHDAGAARRARVRVHAAEAAAARRLAAVYPHGGVVRTRIGGDALLQLAVGCDAAWTRKTLDIEAPAALVMGALSVPPPCVRPSLIAAGASADDGARSSDALTSHLSRIVKLNEAARELLGTLAPADIAEDGAQALAAAIAEFFDTTTRKHASTARAGAATHAEAKMSEGLRQRITGKGKRVRGNLMGKRNNATARSVISPDATLALDAVGLPAAIAYKLTKPRRIAHYNVAQLRAAVCRGARVAGGAAYIVYEWGADPDAPAADAFYLPLDGVTPAKRAELAAALTDAEVVERHLVDGDYVVCNRQPSLHRASMMGHRVRIFGRGCGETLRFNLSVTTPYNADFDGDEMNVHVPQTLRGDAEVMVLAAVPAQLISAGKARPAMGAVQDTLTGLFLLARRDVFLGRADAMELASALAFRDENDGGGGGAAAAGSFGATLTLPPPAVVWPRELWTGKQLLSLVLPHAHFEARDDAGDGTLGAPGTATKRFYANPLARYSRATARARLRVTPADPEDAHVLIVDGELLRGQPDKNVLGAAAGSLVDVIARLDTRAAATFLEDAQRLAHRYMEMASFSIGVADIVPPRVPVDVGAACDAAVAAELRRAHTLIAETRAGARPERALEPALQAVLGGTGNVVTRVLVDAVPTTNGIRATAESGAKGSVATNLRQIMACVGQQLVEGARIAPTFVERTLPHFSRYDAGPEARGHVANSFYSGLEPAEFFFHAMGGREGLIDTAVKTSATGYLQRRLEKLLEDFGVAYDGTVRDAAGAVVQFCYGEDGIDGAHTTRQPLALLAALSAGSSERGGGPSTAAAAATLGGGPHLTARAALDALPAETRAVAQRYWLDHRQREHLDVIMEQPPPGTMVELVCALDAEALACVAAMETLASACARDGAETLTTALPFATAIEEARRRATARRAAGAPLVPLRRAIEARRSAVRRLTAATAPPALCGTAGWSQCSGVAHQSAGGGGGGHDGIAALLRANGVDEREYATATGAALLSQLAARRVVCEYKLDEVSLNEAYAYMIDAWERGRVAAGEMVGVLAAQSVSEPSTQLVLNTFHIAGIGSNGATQGVPRIEEITRLPTHIKTPIVTLRCASKDAAETLAGALQHTTLRDVVRRFEIWYDCGTISGLGAAAAARRSAAGAPGAAARAPEHIFGHADADWLPLVVSVALLDDDHDGVAGAALSPWVARFVFGAAEIDAREGTLPHLLDGARIVRCMRAALTQLCAETPETAQLRPVFMWSPWRDDAHKHEPVVVHLRLCAAPSTPADKPTAAAAAAAAPQKPAKHAKRAAIEGVAAQRQSAPPRRSKLAPPPRRVDPAPTAQRLAGPTAAQLRTLCQRLLDATTLCGVVGAESAIAGTHNTVSVRFAAAEKAGGRGGGAGGTQRGGSGTTNIAKVQVWCAGIGTNETPAELRKPGCTAADAAAPSLAEARAAVDIGSLCTNNPREAYAVLGIEACRAVILRELQEVLTEEGSVSARHLGLLADVMTHRGVPTPVTRDGLVALGRPPLALASFERQMPVFANAALRGHEDALAAVSSRVICGLAPRIGTAVCDVVLDFDALAAVAPQQTAVAAVPLDSVVAPAPVLAPPPPPRSAAETQLLPPLPATPRVESGAPSTPCMYTGNDAWGDACDDARADMWPGNARDDALVPDGGAACLPSPAVVAAADWPLAATGALAACPASPDGGAPFDAVSFDYWQDVVPAPPCVQAPEVPSTAHVDAGENAPTYYGNFLDDDDGDGDDIDADAAMLGLHSVRSTAESAPGGGGYDPAAPGAAMQQAHSRGYDPAARLSGGDDTAWSGAAAAAAASSVAWRAAPGDAPVAGYNPAAPGGVENAMARRQAYVAVH